MPIVSNFFAFSGLHLVQGVCLQNHSISKACIQWVKSFFFFKLHPGQEITRSLLEQMSEVQILGRSNRTQCCQRLVTAAAFLRKELCCLGAMTRRWAPANSLHTSTDYSQYNERFDYKSFFAFLFLFTSSYAYNEFYSFSENSFYLTSIKNDNLQNLVELLSLMMN